MDKLELDDRVSRLEQRVSILSALILAALILAGVSGLFLLIGRSEARIRPATVLSAPPMTTSTVASVTMPMHPIGDMSEGSVGHLVHRYREVAELQHKGLLTEPEAQTRKTQLLAKPIRSDNLRVELEQIAELQSSNAITDAEFKALKAKILEAGK